MDSIVQGFPNVSLSITNPNVSNNDALDKFRPFTFLEFIRIVSQTYQPETLTEFYNTYINRWNIKTDTKPADSAQVIIDRYRDFLKDITLDFTTNAEKTFLTQIDFSDPYDLEIAVSFYSKKIRDITTYYREKRNDLHYTTIKAQLKGSNFGIEQAAKDLIVNFLENRDTASIDYNIQDVKNNLAVSLTEYFDNYSQYFNQEPDDVKYGRNFLGYDPTGLPKDNLFLAEDSTLIQQAFAGVGREILALKEADELFQNKRKQTEKFIGTDFYYLSTNEVGELSDPKILFTADKPYGNFLNQNYPSTASIFSDQIISERNLGFFRPQNSSIVAIEGERVNFFKREKSEANPNKLYIFPDPALYTNNDDIFAFIVDTSRSINNQSKGIAVNQPNTDKESTSFVGYNSEIGQSRNLNTDLTYLYDQGYIDDSKKDLLGNIFGLIKDYDYYRSNVVVTPPKQIKCLTLNGYQFFDSLYGEGYDFDYDTTDSSTFSQTIRSGISSFTNGLTGFGAPPPGYDPFGTVEFPSSAYNLFFRYFNPYQECDVVTDFSQVDYDQPEGAPINTDVKEGGYFMFSDTEQLADPTRSGLSAFTDNFQTEPFYFSELIEAGIGYFTGEYTTNSLFRALSDDTSNWTKSLSGNFTYNVRMSGDNDVKDYDGRLFVSNIIYNYDLSQENFDYRSEVYSPTTFTTVQTANESFFNKRDHIGKIYIKNINKAPSAPAVRELTDTLTYISGKYNATICNELSTAVDNFDILYDTLFIETSSYLVIEKTLYKDYTFTTPGTFTNSLTINTNFFDKVSNRFKIGNDVFYCRMARDQLNFKDTRLYPEIYKYNYNLEKSEQVFPTTANPVISSACFFNLSTNNTVYLECSKPVLTYSSDNEQFNIAVLLKDQNKGPLLVNYLFEYTDKITFLDVDSYNSTDSKFTYNFIDSDAAIDLGSLSFLLCSHAPSITATNVSPIPLSAAALIL